MRTGCVEVKPFHSLTEGREEEKSLKEKDDQLFIPPSFYSGQSVNFLPYSFIQQNVEELKVFLFKLSLSRPFCG